MKLNAEKAPFFVEKLAAGGRATTPGFGYHLKRVFRASGDVGFSLGLCVEGLGSRAFTLCLGLQGCGVSSLGLCVEGLGSRAGLV